MELPDKIFLIGFMGSGKSTHGKRLARLLNRPFIDLDHYIERKENKSIGEIFTKDGESHFRDLEKLYLNQVISRYAQSVISLGGGTPCFNDNMNTILKNGLPIYIQMSPEALFNRISNSANERPLLKGKTKEQSLDFINETLTEREKYYIKALIKVNGIDLTANKLAEELSLFIANN